MLKSSKSNKAAKPASISNTIMVKSNKSNKRHSVCEKSFMLGRYIWTVVFIILGLFTLVARAVYVQIIDSDSLVNQADRRSLRTEQVYSLRGSILDRNQHKLSVSVPMYSITIDPKFILDENSLESDRECWRALAKELKLSYVELVKNIQRNPKSRFAYLARQVSPETAEYVKQLKIKGIVLKIEARRFYPRSEEIAHLIGYTNIDGEGIEGIEKSFNSLLEGRAGLRTYRKDKHGNIVEDIVDVKKYEAQDVTLSIDENLQAMMYAEIKKAVVENNAESGTAVLVDIRTGEILGMATAPSYNPNNRKGMSIDVMRNRAITDTFEPGSTVKPFVVLTALQRGIVNKDTVFDTHPYNIGKYTIKDVAKRDHLTVTGILEQSSNIGVSKIALKMPVQALIETYQNAGLYKPTDLGLVGEQRGSMRSSHNHWSDIDRATFSYGYGLTVTPVQLARAYATLGSFGIYRPLSITKVDPPIIGNRVFSEKASREVVDMLESVVVNGGGKLAAVEGYRVGVKTGTAKKIENGRYVDRYVAFTAGVAPISNPCYALVVLINDPKSGKYYGGAVSAPVFSKIMGNTLRMNNITPDGINIEKISKRTVRLNVSKTNEQLD